MKLRKINDHPPRNSTKPSAVSQRLPAGALDYVLTSLASIPADQVTHNFEKGGDRLKGLRLGGIQASHQEPLTCGVPSMSRCTGRAVQIKLNNP